jgi:hypothetical protein
VVSGRDKGGVGFIGVFYPIKSKVQESVGESNNPGEGVVMEEAPGLLVIQI